uniref:Uncharacterized protein n=1 Tax=uncultured marine group II/III euryarchaeote SAT1000_06_A08 TaxID=1456553 RepID=A0A075I1J0_9EURY|nr:hypothetical protein [uncultured marine group II/III euryarchaeote SAT1000_06_A08]
MELDWSSRRATMFSNSFSLPKKRRVFGRSFSEVTSCFSMCLDRSLSISSAERVERSTVPVSSMYLRKSTCRRGRSVASRACASSNVSERPSGCTRRTDWVLTLDQMSLAMLAPSSVRKYAFLLRDTPVT